MSLAPGARLGPYEIIEPISAGGMGEVYRARDVRLDREVAIKTLLSDFSNDADLLRRFEQEARAAARLSHPHIVTIYDVGTHEGLPYVVSELLEGETLQDRLGAAPLRSDAILEFGIQIADALEAAHTKGIVHRDIKPSNIFVTPHSKLKVLDFGLAKLVRDPSWSRAGTPGSRVSGGPRTEPGTAMGTIAYMSPEQARGEDLDARTDLFSFGIVLYEMATGMLPFRGATTATIFDGILNKDPVAPSALNPDLPAELGKLIERAIEKERELRYQTAADMRADLSRLRRDLLSGRTAAASGRYPAAGRTPEASAPSLRSVRSAPSNPEIAERKLAAIMFTDIVGYSALTERNEALALEILSEHNRLVRSIVPEHRGREIKTMGDAFLVEFGSALDAARCAIELQKTLAERNLAAPADRRLDIRIGLHVGDVVYQNNDVFGDGVNIASRIQPLAEAGGICVSEDVARQIQNKIELPLQKLGRGELKNIHAQVGIYRVLLPWHHETLRFSHRLAFLLGRRRTRLMLQVSGATAVLAVAGWLGLARYLGWKTLFGGFGSIETIAVLPLANLSGDPAQDYLVDGMTEELIDGLARIRALRVISRTTVMQYKGVRRPLPEIARELGAEGIVEGSVARFGNRVRITAKLVDGRHDRALWSESYEGDLSDVLNLQSSVARAVASQVRVELSPQEKVVLSSNRTIDPEAHELYLRGRFHWNRRTQADLKQAVTYFEKAITRDAVSPLPYSGLADCYILMSGITLSPRDAMPKAQLFARKALEIDGMLAEAQTSLAAVAAWYEWDWTSAERGFRRAIELKPNYATARHWLAFCLAATGKPQEAMKEMSEAHARDPLAPSINAGLASVYYLTGNYGETLKICRRMIELDPGSQPAYNLMGRALTQTGKPAEALDAFLEPIKRVQPEIVPRYRKAFVEDGLRGYWRMQLELLKGFAAGGGYVSPQTMAGISLEIGDREQALSWLEKAYSERSFLVSVVHLKIDPVYQPLRSDPRFQDLLRRVGLAQ